MLPEGFVLDEPNVSQQGLPEGFVVDEPAPTQPQQAQTVEEPSMMDRVMQYKQELGQTISEFSPMTQIPQMVSGFAAEVTGKEGTQVAEAMSVKSRLENIDFAYSDLADAFKAGTGNGKAIERIKTKQNKLNDEVVNILKDRGIEAYNDEGKLLVVQTDAEGNEVVKDLDENTLDEVLGAFTASAGEIGGAIIGATGGAVQAQRLLPTMATPAQRVVAGSTGAALGGYTGATLGRATDLIRNAISLNKDIDAREVAEKATAAGVADIAALPVAAAIGKGVTKITEPLAKASDRLKTLFTEGDIKGATRVVKEDYGVSDQEIDTLFEGVKKDVEGVEDLRGDDLQRAKLLAVVQQQPQGTAIITSAIRKNAKAAIETSKEIDSRAREVMKSVGQFSKKPSAIKRSIAAYEKAVGKNYGEVKKLIDQALPTYKSDLDIQEFKPILDDLNSRVIDPQVKDKLTNLTSSLASQKTETVGDLINVRQLFNKFYGKNAQHFETKPDKDALLSIQKTIDGKIDEALQTLPGSVGKQLKAAFTDAKKKYTNMFKTQDTATYNAIFRKGASEDDIGKALVKYSKSADGDLEGVLSKLSPTQRTKSEFSILKQMVDTATSKQEAKAIDFKALLEDIGSSKAVFKTPEAKQFLKNIETFDKKFAKDVDIQKIAAGVSPQVEKNIATGLAGKIIMKLSALRFEALQRLMGTETARRLSLQKAIESALEKSRNSKEFFFNASKIKGLPSKDRENLKKAIKEISDKADQLKKQVEKEMKKDAEKANEILKQ